MADDKDTAQDPTAAPEAVPEGLAPEDAARFGNQPSAEQPSGYIANFDGDEIDGRTYRLGERIADNVDPGTIAFLVQNGRITPTTAGMEGSPSGGDETSIPTGGPAAPETGNPAFADLNAEQTTEAQKLVDSNSKDDLLKLAKDEGVTDVTEDNNKSEIAAKIVAARNA